ncbi:secretory lipase family protein [Mycobacterium xenopi 4042]|uniref:Secretory lipase family protein n=1 Tax=Mycobacterium xenopi 4042 TaxID=1299334 RepID=X8BEH9_MYCXE|nr:secretory lipase family protein [Mycobacterium xenopi 4042]
MIAALAHVTPTWTGDQEAHQRSGRTLLRQLEEMTTVGAVIRMAGRTSTSTSTAAREILESAEVQYVFDNIKLGTAVPTPPILIVQAVHDYLIAVEDIDALATPTRAGADVTYHRDAFNEHLLLHPLSRP